MGEVLQHVLNLLQLVRQLLGLVRNEYRFVYIGLCGLQGREGAFRQIRGIGHRDLCGTWSAPEREQYQPTSTGAGKVMAVHRDSFFAGVSVSRASAAQARP